MQPYQSPVSYQPLQRQAQFSGFPPVSAPNAPPEPRLMARDRDAIAPSFPPEPRLMTESTEGEDDDDEESELLRVQSQAWKRRWDVQIHKTRQPSSEDIKSFLDKVESDANKRSAFTAGYQSKVVSARSNIEFQSKISTDESYSIFCSVRDIGKEIGATYTFFFTFVRLLVALMLVYWVLLLPLYILNLYVGHAHPDLINDWNRVTTSDCTECTGDNKGHTGPAGANIDGYGTRCAPWDLDVCGSAANEFGFPPGTWCCKSWCYVKPGCLQALRAWGAGGSLYYRYKACEDDATVMASCPYPDLAESPETSGNGTRQFEMMGTWIGATGNLGWRKGSFALWGPRLGCVAGVISMLITMVSLVYFRIYQVKYFDEIEEGEIIHDPSDWALLVTGLPKHELITEKQVSDFIRYHALEGKEVEVVKTVLIYNVTSVEDLLQSRKSLVKKLETAAPDDYLEEETSLKKFAKKLRPTFSEIRQEIRDIDESIADIAGSTEEEDRLRSSGSAVVSVRYRRDAREILKRWYSTITAAGDPCGANMWFVRHFLPSCAPNTPRFVYESHEYLLDITKAPNPGDFMWENAGTNPLRRAVNYAVVLALVFALLSANLVILYWLGVWELSLAEAETNEVTGKVVFRFSFANALYKLLPPLCVSVVNTGLTFLISDVTGPAMKRLTKSGEQGGIAFLLSSALIISTSLSKLFLLSSPVSWYRDGGLAPDVLLLMLTQGGLGVFMIGVDIKYIAKRFVAKFLVDPGMLEVTQEQYLNLHEPEEPQLYRWYPYCVNIFFLSAIYCPIVPIAPLIGAISLTMCYWTAKARLLKHCRRPRLILNSQMDKIMQDYLQMVLVVVPLTFWWILPTYRATSYTVKYVMLICLSLGVVFILAPKTMIYNKLNWVKNYDIVTVRDFSELTMLRNTLDDYYCIQHLWPPRMKYHKNYLFMRWLPPQLNPEILQRPVASRSLSADSGASRDASLIELLQKHKDQVAAVGLGVDS